MALPINFPILAERRKQERDRLTAKLAALQKATVPNAQDIARYKAILALPTVDPLYLGLQQQFSQTGQAIGNLDNGGDLPSQQHPHAAGAGSTHPLTNDETAFVAVYGLLVRDNAAPPSLDDPSFNVRKRVWDDDDDNYRRWVKAAVAARAEYGSRNTLYDNVLDSLKNLSAIPGKREVDARQWASVTDTLIRQRVEATDFQLPTRVQSAISIFEADETAPSSLDLTILDLDGLGNVNIVRDNVVAAKGLYWSAACEEMGILAVVDKLREMFQLGMLPFGRSQGGDLLYLYGKKAVTRMTEIERRNVYARTFGFPGGDPNALPNREFSDLWLRFVSAVSEAGRQVTLDRLLTSPRPGSVSQEQVRKSGRDLAANLSLHTYGAGHVNATEITSTIGDAIQILSSQDLLDAFGAKDIYSLMEQVSALELGGARNTTRYRTIAQAGAVIIAWLADHALLLASTGRSRVLDMQSIQAGTGRPSSVSALDHPSDADLVDACEQWLAVTGTVDAQVEQFSQASEGPAITSRPIPIPAFARDLLAQAGVSANGH